MKYTITINQHAIFANGLVGKTDLVDWAIVDYLKDFSLYTKARKIVYKNEEFIWLNYKHLMVNLPLIEIKSKMGITKRINKLKTLGLIKTIQKKDNTLYYTFTDRLIDIIFVKKSDLERIKNSAPVCSDDTPPVRFGDTGAVRRGYTAQYITKNTILNKDINKDNNNDISFFSSFKKLNKEKNGFVSLPGNVWRVLDNIRQKQIQNSKVKMQNEI